MLQMQHQLDTNGIFVNYSATNKMKHGGTKIYTNFFKFEFFFFWRF